MNKKKFVFLFAIFTMFLIMSINGYANSSWGFYSDIFRPPYLIEYIRANGSVTTYNDSALNPWDDDSCMATTYVDSNSTPNFSISVYAQMYYTSGGNSYTAYGPTDSWSGSKNGSTGYERVYSFAEADTSNATSAYGYHYVNYYNGSESGTTNESF